VCKNDWRLYVLSEAKARQWQDLLNHPLLRSTMKNKLPNNAFDKLSNKPKPNSGNQNYDKKTELQDAMTNKKGKPNSNANSRKPINNGRTK
jgi:hypothetical protein